MIKILKNIAIYSLIAVDEEPMIDYLRWGKNCVYVFYQ